MLIYSAAWDVSSTNFYFLGYCIAFTFNSKIISTSLQSPTSSSIHLMPGPKEIRYLLIDQVQSLLIFFFFVTKPCSCCSSNPSKQNQTQLKTECGNSKHSSAYGHPKNKTKQTNPKKTTQRKPTKKRAPKQQKKSHKSYMRSISESP